MKLTLKEIAFWSGGTLIGDGNLEITEFFTDSRQGGKGKMFVPVKGEKVDAHRFISAVFAQGACTFSEKPIHNPQGSYILVPHAIEALQAVAMQYRNTFAIPFIGVTGSVGKTTTKEMIALALESEKAVLKTAGNANSQIGLPLTLLRVTSQHEAAIIEMGMSLPGEMERLAFTARPNLAVMTNIGVSHIEFHGTREKIMEQKLHIVDFFTPDSILFANGDDDLLCTLKARLPGKVIFFGTGKNCDYRATEISENEEGSHFTCLRGGEKIFMFVPVPGLHNVRNALVSLAVAENTGVTTESAVRAIAGYMPPEMRQQIKKIGRYTVIDDTYNASPDSMFGALEILSKLEGGKKIAVLADMLELGAYSEKGHRDVGEYARKMKIDTLIGVGPEAKYMADGFANPQSAHLFTENEGAFAFLETILADGDILLIKGSRGMKTDYFVKRLMDIAKKKSIEQ